MSGSYNRVVLIGNLGKDPELKMSPQGQAMARFSVATTETWKDGQGQKQSKTEWHNVVVWGKQAEIAEKFLRKGAQVMVEGRIQYREYEKDGVKRQTTDIRCDSFVMLGSKSDNAGGAPRSGGFGAPPSGPQGGGSGFDDDIPF